MDDPGSDQDIRAKMADAQGFLEALEGGNAHIGTPFEGRTEAKILALRHRSLCTRRLSTSATPIGKASAPAMSSPPPPQHLARTRANRRLFASPRSGGKPIDKRPSLAPSVALRSSTGENMAESRKGTNAITHDLGCGQNGAERIAPGTPHSQNQNTKEKTTRTGLSVNCLARSIGVTVSPSITWIAP